MILNYIKEMTEYLIYIIPVYLLIRFIIYLKTKKLNLKKEIIYLLFISYLTSLLTLTIIPKENTPKGFNIIPLKIIYDSIIEFNNENIYYFIISLLGNIIIFIPIGILLPLIKKLKDKQVILYGFLLSLSIEFIQLFQNRWVDIDDLILNTLGTFIGLIIYKKLKVFLTF